MGNIIPFEYSGNNVRVITVDGEPWFVGSDVARALGYSNTRDAIAKHCKGSRKTRHPSDGGQQEMTIIPEPDVYRLIVRSKLPAAEKFEKWVMEEVLPSIRKTGGYQMPTYPEALRIAADALEKLDRAQPAIDFYKAVTDSKTAIPMSQVAKVLDMGVGRNKLFAFLRDEGVLMKSNEPYQEYVDRGWFRVVEQKYTRADGETHINIKTLVYQKGLSEIRRLYEKSVRKSA